MTKKLTTLDAFLLMTELLDIRTEEISCENDDRYDAWDDKVSEYDQ